MHNNAAGAPSPPQWNGRQIRNAFHLASSLAYSSMAEKCGTSEQQDGASRQSTVTLDDSQFRTVVKTMGAFDRYMEKTKGHSPADLAFLEGIRSDFWNDRDLQETQHRQGSATSYPETGQVVYRANQSDTSNFQPRSRQTNTLRAVHNPGSSVSRLDMSFQQEDNYVPRPYAHFQGSRDRVSRSEPDESPWLQNDRPWPRQHAERTERTPPMGLHDPPATRHTVWTRSDPGYAEDRRSSSTDSSQTTRGVRPRRLEEYMYEQDDGDDDYTQPGFRGCFQFLTVPKYSCYLGIQYDLPL